MRKDQRVVPIKMNGKQLTAGELKAMRFYTCSAVMKNGEISHFEIDTGNRQQRRAQK